MEYIKTKIEGKWIVFDSIRFRAVVVDKEQLNQELDMLDEQLEQLPPDPELLDWAKKNYEGQDFLMLQERKMEIEEILANLKETIPKGL